MQQSKRNQKKSLQYNESGRKRAFKTRLSLRVVGYMKKQYDGLFWNGKEKT